MAEGYTLDQAVQDLLSDSSGMASDIKRYLEMAINKELPSLFGINESQTRDVLEQYFNMDEISSYKNLHSAARDYYSYVTRVNSPDYTNTERNVTNAMNTIAKAWISDMGLDPDNLWDEAAQQLVQELRNQTGARLDVNTLPESMMADYLIALGYTTTPELRNYALEATNNGTTDLSGESAMPSAPYGINSNVLPSTTMTTREDNIIDYNDMWLKNVYPEAYDEDGNFKSDQYLKYKTVDDNGNETWAIKENPNYQATYPTSEEGNPMYDWGVSTFGEEAWQQLTPVERYQIYNDYLSNQPATYELGDTAADVWAAQNLPGAESMTPAERYSYYLNAMQYPTTPQPGFLDTGYGKTAEWNPAIGEWQIRNMTAEELSNPAVYGSYAWANDPENWWESAQLNRQLKQAGQNIGSQYTKQVAEPVASYFQGIGAGQYGRDINPQQQYGLAATPTWGNLQNLSSNNYTQFRELTEGLGYDWEDLLKKSYEAQPPVARTGLSYGYR